MSRMYERIERGELAIGTLMSTHGQEIVEILGYSGFDWVCIDMMTTSLDWTDVATMILAAKRYDVTPWIRLSNHPWSDGGANTALPAEALRAVAIGAECVMASVNTAAEVEQLLRPLANAHRRFYVMSGGADRTDEQRRLDELEPEQRIFPCLESLEAIKHIDEIVEVEGLKMIYLGMGDLTKGLGHPGDDRHPEVREAIRGIVAKAERHGIVVCANTLAYKGDEEDLSLRIAAGTESLWDLGVRAVLIPRPAMILQRFYESTIGRVRERIPAGRGA